MEAVVDAVVASVFASVVSVDETILTEVPDVDNFVRPLKESEAFEADELVSLVAVFFLLFVLLQRHRHGRMIGVSPL